jgi:hypothetical protein
MIYDFFYLFLIQASVLHELQDQQALLIYKMFTDWLLLTATPHNLSVICWRIVFIRRGENLDTVYQEQTTDVLQVKDI